MFEVDAGSGTITTLASFNDNNGDFPEAGLVEDGSGNLFGTTSVGGASRDGTVFEVKAGSGTVTTLASFNSANGAIPKAGLVEDGSGDLFGATSTGGASSGGTVFEVRAGSGTITTLASFSSFNTANGEDPVAGLVEDGSGDLFGTTLYGGASSDGTVFEVRAGSGTITTLGSFSGTKGAFPEAGLIEDGTGNLFGTTLSGGALDYGTVFELPVLIQTVNRASTSTSLVSSVNPSVLGQSVTFTATVAVNSPGSNAVANPTGAVTFYDSGISLGTGTLSGASPDTATFTTTMLSVGRHPITAIYPGDTNFAGSGTPSTPTTLASFNITNGANPEAGLVEDSSGNLFGTTAGGGASKDGTVFEVRASSGTITTLASFNGTNGEFPAAGLVEDSSGNLFGTTSEGGASKDGTVFEVRAGSGTITTLASFNGTNGDGPAAGLVEDSSGNLFGTTAAGGASNDGTVFEVKAGSGTITTLASFNGTNGARPLAGLVEDSSGNLFGTTLFGGASGDGTVFEVKAGSGTITTLASFNGSNGASLSPAWSRTAAATSSAPPLGAARPITGRCSKCARQRHHHHSRFLQRHQRHRARCRPGRGQQRQSLRHHRGRRRIRWRDRV